MGWREVIILRVKQILFSPETGTISNISNNVPELGLLCLVLLRFVAASLVTDPHSVARPDLIKTSHLHIDLEADFERKIFFGKVVLSLEKVDPDVSVLSLDVRNLTVNSVTSSGQELVWNLKEENKFGDRLEIMLGKGILNWQSVTQSVRQ